MIMFRGWQKVLFEGLSSDIHFAGDNDTSLDVVTVSI